LVPKWRRKTTTLRMLLGLVRPSDGVIRVFGRDPALDPVAALGGVSGFVEEPAFYPYLSARTNLELLAGIDRGVPRERITEVLDRVGLSARATDRVARYSHGMRQRLGIAAALLRRPRLLVLDEPTNGLDPPGMRDMRTLVRELASEGLTILLSSHDMTEVEELCSRVAIIQRGTVRYEGPLGALLAEAQPRYHFDTSDTHRTASLARLELGNGSVRVDDRGGVWVDADRDAVGALSVALGRNGIAVYTLTPRTESLEDRFFALTEHEQEPSA
jgi:ABC-2 type transport system ATP-binding protein